MAWTITVNDLQDIDTDKVKEACIGFTGEHPEYEHDVLLALEMARRAGLSSATLTGVRAPNPYGTDEVIDISVRGLAQSSDFITGMMTVISAGPADDSLSVLHEKAAAFIRENPCDHNFLSHFEQREYDDFPFSCPVSTECRSSCEHCGVHLHGGLLHYLHDLQ